ncbi:Phosphomannose isomerase [Planctomycetales bacterium 10988]|nr:Phosphomannose isomerase [Planctomycetales bacterium 10988]
MAEQVATLLNRAMDAGEGLLRLTPTWVPRSFLHPGRRIKLAPQDYYAFGAHRGGIDERWFASTTDAANENRTEDEGLSYFIFEGEKAQLKDAVAESGASLIGQAMWDKYERWPVYSKFFDNMGPIPHHMHQGFEDAALVGQQGKPESYYFPPQLNNVDNNFAYTFMGLEPGTTKADLRKCLENWSQGDNGILDLSRAYRLKRGTGWLIPPGVLHAPGSLCTYEPQWGSDVFGMFQSLVEGREVPWSLLVKDVPEEKHQDLDFIIGQLDWDKNVETHFKEKNYLEPIVDESRSGEGYTDRWIVYGTVDGTQYFSAKELTVEPGAKCTLKDPGASGWITVQGRGRMGKLALQTPAMIHFGETTEDEVFISYEAANNGVEIENLGSEPLVGLRYFGPDTHDNLPTIEG